MKQRSLVIFSIVAGLMLLAGPASAGHPHFVGRPTCTVSGETLTCAGKIAGLGTAPTTVTISVPVVCQNRGGHNPPGQASGSTEPIPPRGGQITFSVSTTSDTCPDDMRLIFGSTATITVVQNGEVVFQGTVPVTQ